MKIYEVVDGRQYDMTEEDIVYIGTDYEAAKEALKGRYIINKYNFNSKYYFNGKKASRARKNNIIIKNHRFW